MPEVEEAAWHAVDGTTVETVKGWQMVVRYGDVVAVPDVQVETGTPKAWLGLAVQLVVWYPLVGVGAMFWQVATGTAAVLLVGQLVAIQLGATAAIGLQPPAATLLVTVLS